MSILDRAKNRWTRWTRGSALRVWYAPSYRLPLASVESIGLDARRADRVLGYLLHTAVVSRREVQEPERIRYQDLARVHSDELLTSLQQPETLASIFAVDSTEIIVDELLHTVRQAAGGTLAGARHALQTGRPNLNLLGGFHHAGRDRASGFCPINDIAVAVATLRHEGFTGTIAILDLDAHPPDGIAECLSDFSDVWIGSISGTDWGVLPGVDETRLPTGADDALYLSTLDALLGRAPPSDLAFVIAGADVLAGDRYGGFSLTLSGVRTRDLKVAVALRGLPSVWLPGGGYSSDAWRVLAGTALAIGLDSGAEVPRSYDPLRAHYAFIAKKLSRDQLEGAEFTEADLLTDLGAQRPIRINFLDFYTAEGLEHALFRYGILAHLRRLGYGDFRVLVDRNEGGDRLRLMAKAEGAEHLLLECVLQKRILEGEELLYVHWLTLRNPRARFSAKRPQLPGQEVPGLGLARETGELIRRAAERLDLAGVALRPAWFHTAYAGLKMGMRFRDARRQGRFLALLRDLNLKHWPLLEVTNAIAEHRVLLNGQPYPWEAELMVYRSHGAVFDDQAEVKEAEESSHFTVISPGSGEE